MIINTTNDSIKEAERHIKIFLNMFDDFDNEFRNKYLQIDDIGNIALNKQS